ncbi:unnamed protein product [Calypogeia fissa]
MAREEAVILVVGGETECKLGLTFSSAEALAMGCGASEAETTKAGVHVFRRKSSPEPVVIAPTPLLVYKNYPALDLSEIWISLNALRRLYGKLICVVCVVTYSGPQDSFHLKPKFVDNVFNWLHLLGFIFRDYKHNILVSVRVSKGTTDSPAMRSIVTNVLQQDGYVKSNVIFEKMGGTDSPAVKSRVSDVLKQDGYVKSSIMFEKMFGPDLIQTVRTALERRVFYGKNSQNVDNTIAFRLKEMTSESKDLDRYGHWGPAEVILLGRTGSGKSTLFQMLTKGRLDPFSISPASSSIRGETKEVKHGEGRGWYVVDTPGFGEPKNDEQSTISTEEAQKRIGKFVQRIQGTYSHFVYVVMKDRIDMLDKRLWEFFKLLFEGNEFNFTIVVSNADQDWLDRHIAALRTDFSGCESFLCGEFPPTKTDDEEWETELEEVRAESLKRLEDELASLRRSAIHCSIGVGSSSSMKRLNSSVFLEINEERDAVVKALKKPLAHMVIGGAKAVVTFLRITDGRLSAILKNGEKFLLLPPS